MGGEVDLSGADEAKLQMTERELKVQHPLIMKVANA